MSLPVAIMKTTGSRFVLRFWNTTSQQFYIIAKYLPGLILIVLSFSEAAEANHCSSMIDMEGLGLCVTLNIGAKY